MEGSVLGTGRILGTRELPDASDEELRKQERQAELLRLGKLGFRIFLEADIDYSHRPWLVASDSSIWIADGGEPQSGYSPTNSAIFVEADGSWGFLTAAAASQIPNWPRTLTELEERARQREQKRKRDEQEQTRTLERKRKTARVVVLNDLERGMPTTLRAALVQLDQIGGQARISRGRLLVEVPTSELGMSEYGPKIGTRVATFLYRCEQTLAEMMRGKDGVLDPEQAPDVPVTPTGSPIK